jgi:DNA (cytosine-5)-methyltransferase 1
MDLGFQAAGFRPVGFLELEDWACKTLHRNHPSVSVIGPPRCSGDLKELSTSEIAGLLGAGKGDIDVIIGGPPCQPFSIASNQRFLRSDDKFKRKGFEDEDKGNLLFDFVRVVSELLPSVFVIENVSGLIEIDNGEQIKIALGKLQNIGYNITTPEVINAVSYGVPQFRNRVIIWGTMKKINPLLPQPTHGNVENLLFRKYNVVCQALYGVSSVKFNNETRDHKIESIARYKTLKFGEREHLGRVDRLDPMLPSKTVIAGGRNGGGRSHLHPFLARTMSVRECARLQSFPDDYIFEGTNARQFTQVGNAVPPLLAEQIGRQILTQAFGIKVKEDLILEQYLLHDQPIEDLTRALRVEAIKLHSDLLYNDVHKI